MSSVGKHALHICLRGLFRNNANTFQRYQNILKIPRRSHSYEADGKTTVSILNQESESGLMIDSYSQLGFRLNNGMVVIGPMVIFPRSVLSWNVGGPEDINEDALTLFTLLVPKLDILVVGVGDNTRDLRLSRDLVAFMRSSKINVEALPTEQACTTFNFLNAEGRYVGAALIPPNNLRHTDDDVVMSKIKQRRLYGPESEEGSLM